mmetsp:Transcript_30738/g.89211  ORF Transcript_30738/g.89211 Transcript_30738/m.89211 type:complete len:230 (+) Transcript_30738:1030-1719(+)
MSPRARRHGENEGPTRTRATGCWRQVPRATRRPGARQRAPNAALSAPRLRKPQFWLRPIDRHQAPASSLSTTFARRRRAWNPRRATAISPESSRPLVLFASLVCLPSTFARRRLRQLISWETTPPPRRSLHAPLSKQQPWKSATRRPTEPLTRPCHQIAEIWAQPSAPGGLLRRSAGWPSPPRKPLRHLAAMQSRRPEGGHPRRRAKRGLLRPRLTGSQALPLALPRPL